ncbi:MAG: hypothetical protein ACKV2V_08680, partial [Blastocatellia bacterium]
MFCLFRVFRGFLLCHGADHLSGSLQNPRTWHRKSEQSRGNTALLRRNRKKEQGWQENGGRKKETNLTWYLFS